MRQSSQVLKENVCGDTLGVTLMMSLREEWQLFPNIFSLSYRNITESDIFLRDILYSKRGAKVQKSQINNSMYSLSPFIRSGSCCTTRLCPPCCGSGSRPGTFINRWPRSLRRAKMVTRLRPLDSPCWGKHKCHRNLEKEKYINSYLCVHTVCVFVPLCVWRVFLIFLLLLLLLAVCVPLQRSGTGSLHNYLLSYFIFFVSTWPDWDCEM